jgi:mannose-6-phosphate isomerase-like protein (cupin superfamily)
MKIGREKSETLFTSKKFKVKKIISPKNFSSKIFLQAVEEWVIILQGSAVLEIKGKKVKLSKGKSLYIPSNTKHRIVSTSKNTNTIWLAVYVK